MDFFEAQARAKKRSARLVVLFGLAVLGTIAVGYLATIFGLGQLDGRRFVLWQPQVLLGVAGGTIAVVALASLFKWSQFSAGGSAVAESVGGRRVDPHTTDTHERRLINVVEEMAIASGTPVPAIYIIDDEPGINAFAAGLTANDAVVAVTRGTLEKLSRDELQGVVGHEFSHILNGDMRLNLRLAAIVFGILVLGIAGRSIIFSLRHARVGRGKKDGGGALLAIMFAGFVLLLIGYVGYFFGRLIQAAVSRQREFLADASAVQFTRNPAGIAGALKKIGGYALGSSLQSTKSAAIGHFFFAQSFRSNFGGLWATHPPLAERIRAIEPQFDGQFFEPPQVVDVRRESFSGRGLSSAGPARPLVSALAPEASTTAVAQSGSLTMAQLANAQTLLDAVPERLRAAAHSPHEAPVLLFGLLLDAAEPVRANQRAIVGERAGGDALRILDELTPALRQLRPEHKLPLVQLALPELRQLPPSALTPALDTLDELVHTDAQVSPFEFALQKVVLRSLSVGRAPGKAGVVQIYSFNAVVDEISVVLSALARAAVSTPGVAPRAFAAGAAQLKLVESQLHFLEPAASDPAALEAALDKLATASLPIKQRTLVAGAHVINADGRVLVAELELLRAIAATLDVPVPALA